jgi:hypothetical protein
VTEQGYRNATIKTGQSRQDWTTGTEHPGQDSRDKSVGTGRPDRLAWTGHLEQDQEDRTARIWQKGQTAGAERPGQDYRTRTHWT